MPFLLQIQLFPMPVDIYTMATPATVETTPGEVACGLPVDESRGCVSALM